MKSPDGLLAKALGKRRMSTVGIISGFHGVVGTAAYFVIDAIQRYRSGRYGYSWLRSNLSISGLAAFWIATAIRLAIVLPAAAYLGFLSLTETY
jgi:hypothetical protein